MIDFLRNLGSADTTVGAIVIAAFTALVAVLSWMFAQIVGWIGRFFDARKERQTAIIKFYLDVRIGIKNSDEIFTEEVRDTYISLIRDSSKNFKAYAEITVDDSASIRINELLHTLKSREMLVVRKYIMYNDLFNKQYKKTGTEDFEKLTIQRKISVVKALFDLAAHVSEIGDKVVAELGKRKFVKKIDADIDELLARRRRMSSEQGR